MRWLIEPAEARCPHGWRASA